MAPGHRRGGGGGLSSLGIRVVGVSETVLLYHTKTGMNIITTTHNTKWGKTWNKTRFRKKYTDALFMHVININRE